MYLINNQIVSNRSLTSWKVPNTDANALAYEYDALNRPNKTKLNNVIISEQFYDDYTQSTYAFDLAHAYGQSKLADAKGLPTISRTYVATLNNKALTTVIFYDNLGRAIQTLADNHLDTSPDRTSSLLDFTGRTLESKQNLRNLQTITKQSYEIGGRLKAICSSIAPPSGGGGRAD